MNEFEYKIFLNSVTHNIANVTDDNLRENTPRLTAIQYIEAYAVINSIVVKPTEAKHIIRILSALQDYKLGLL